MNMNKLSSFLLCAAFALCLTATNLTAAGPATVPLGNAGHFAVLAGTSVTNAGHSVINGDLGVAPGTSVTGFKPVPLAGPGVVNGTIYTPLKYCTPKACVTQSNTAAADGQASLLVAYNDAAGRTVGVVGVAGDLGGTTLTPGLYNSTSTLAITGDLT